MSTASAPNPNNMILLAVLGIGAYWLFSRQAMARPVTAIRPAGSNAAQTAGTTANLINAGANVLGKLFGGSGAAVPTGTGYVREIANDDLPGQAGYGWKYYGDGTAISPTGTYYQNGEAVWSPSSDSVAFNPPGNVSAFDAIYMG